MISKSLFKKSWNTLRDIENESVNLYVEKGIIPIGTINHPFSYEGKEPPEEDIVSIPFDSMDKHTDAREPLNILILGGQGDGKTKLMKNIWLMLHEAGWYCVYIDPKSTSSGRAKLPSSSTKFLPPKIKPRGIKLKHYIPIFAKNNFSLEHNFLKYAIRLRDLDEVNIWMGLGATYTGASKISNIVKNDSNISVSGLLNQLDNLRQEGIINASSLTSMKDKINNLVDLNYLTDKIPELELMNDFQAGYSVCISYNAFEEVFMSLDVGLKIKKCRTYFNSHNNRVPIIFFLDDSGFYAEHENIGPTARNYAISEIKRIGFVYRSLGISNCMAVQTLSIIDSKMAEGYNVKIITPKFDNPDELSKIGVPKAAIAYLKEPGLVQDKDNYISQLMIIDQNREIKLCYPFNVIPNHFKEVYSSGKVS